MVRVYLPVLLPLLLLPACSTSEQAQAPSAAATQLSPQTAGAPAQETLADCAYKTSVIEAWSCASKIGADAR
jgi:hypothetical protein